MASLSSSSPGKPLQLKDFLREDINSDSCGGAAGFRGMPRRLPDQTVRYLLAVELHDNAGGDRSLRRCRSKGGALTKITAVINAVKMLPFASSAPSSACSHNCGKPLPKQDSFLSRSFSRKLRRSFWRKRDKGEHRLENNAAMRTIVRVKDIVRLRSFGQERKGAEVMEKTAPASPPSPVRSTKSSSTSSGGGGGGWSDSDSAGSDSLSCGSSVCGGEAKDGSSDTDGKPCASPRSAYVVRAVGGDSISKATCYQEPMVKEEETGGKQGIGCPCQFEEEKDQLSPVSVMDFPYEEEEEDHDNEDGGDSVQAERAAAAAASPPTTFHRNLAKLERTKSQLLQKIRAFESLAALVDPVDLDSRFASEADELESEDRDDPAADDVLLQFQVEIEERAFALLRELKRRGSPSSERLSCGGGCTDGLLVDFFIERLSDSRRGDVGFGRRYRRTVAREAEDAEEALLQAAEEWISGCRRGQATHGWEAEVKEMEADGRWRCAHVDEEEEDIAGGLGAVVLESLVDELLVDLIQT